MLLITGSKLHKKTQEKKKKKTRKSTVATRSGRTMHPSIIVKGNGLQHRKVSPSVFGCPLCPIFITRSPGVTQRHLQRHLANGVHFEGKIICRCNLQCRDGGHFHCTFCETTILRKETITMHLIGCQKKSDIAQLTFAPPCRLPSSESHPAALSPAALTAVKIDHSYTMTASPDTPAEREVTGHMPPTHIKCPHCPVVLYRKNLFLHVARKHGKPKDINAETHLPSTSVDQRNGLYAVRKTSRGFSVPVHVQRKTWGEHQVRCEMEDCRQYHLLTQQSALSHSLCQHIRSINYCTTAASEEKLDQQVLQEMVDNLFFEDSKATVCKKRQQQAEEACVPLSVLVDVSGSKTHVCLSLHEPQLHHYSTLGRVFVTYNIQKNTWHCPCAKARASCAHKCIANWHLFQTHRHLFRTSPLTTTSVMPGQFSAAPP